MDLSWIFESIVNWVASIVTSIMDAVSGIFLDALGTDMTAMEQYFPFVTEAFSIFQYSAWALLFLITVWQLFRVFGGPVTEAENPWQLLIRSAIFALLIGYAKPIFLLALDIARAPYTALLDATMDPGSFTFAGVEQVIQNGLTTLVSTITVIGPLLTIILMISLGWNYFKMLLECVERYVVVGVLCYTSPLAFAMGGSKTTSNVFKGWTRMVGSQLLLLVLNVWFLRAFNSTVGQFVGGGALSTGQGSIFLWMFVALAFLKTAQKFDAYLAAMGLNVAQTGSSMGMELLMAARVISGVASGGARTAGSIFRGASGAPGAAGAAAGGGFFAGFASRFKPNSYVRDAVVEGGTPMGAGGSIGLVARTFGGMAARNGATLSSESIASVAARPGNVAGTIAGEIADRSAANYMPQLQGYSLSGTQITGGRISSMATSADGKTSEVEMFSTSQFERPSMPHSIVTAQDGSQWYQTAVGDGAGSFYTPAAFAGTGVGETLSQDQVFAAFGDSVAEGTTLRTVGHPEEGVLEASHPDYGTSMWYNSAMYQEPDAPHDTIQSTDGVGWYAMQPHITKGSDGTANGTTEIPNEPTLVLVTDVEILDDQTEKLLPGGTFDIVNAEGELVQSGTLGENGDRTIRYMTPGKYTLKQTKAPLGYVLQVEEYAFEINSNGYVTGDTKIINTPTVVVISKLDPDKKAVADATYEIYNGENEKVFAGKTDEEGKLTAKYLSAGEYTYKETKAPSGYALNPMAYAFEIDEAGGVTGTFLVTDPFASIVIKKVDAKTDKPLPGAQFGLYDSTDKLLTSLTTDNNGLVQFTKLPWGIYSVKELKAPTGYTVNGKLVQVEITETYQNPEEPHIVENSPAAQTGVEGFPWWGVALLAVCILGGGGCAWYLLRKKRPNGHKHPSKRNG